jgi:hypothetical protein
MSNPEVWGKIHMKNVKLVRVFGQGEDAGLFTSDDDMEIWGLAHRILLPAFSNQGMKAYFSLVERTVDDLFTVVSPSVTQLLEHEGLTSQPLAAVGRLGGCERAAGADQVVGALHVRRDWKGRL